MGEEKFSRMGRVGQENILTFLCFLFYLSRYSGTINNERSSCFAVKIARICLSVLAKNTRARPKAERIEGGARSAPTDST